MTDNKADEFIEKLFDSLLSMFQILWKTSMRSNNFIFVCVNLLWCKWINTINKSDNKCFQCAATVAQRITKINLCINEYNSEEIKYLSEKDDWRKLEKNNPLIFADLLYEKKNESLPSSWRMALSCSRKVIRIVTRINGDSYCLNWLHSFKQKISLILIKRCLKTKNFVEFSCPPKRIKY